MTSPLSGECCDCGESFTVDPAVTAKYPGWVPKRCRKCHRGSAGSRGVTGNKGNAKGAGKRGVSGTANTVLTVDEVLKKFHNGPTSGLFTDGSASPNPGPGGWGAVYVVDGEVVDQCYGSNPDTTNNRMELTAIANGVRIVPEGEHVTVYTDSKLAVQTLNQWAHGWKKRGWKRKKGPVENLDLVQPLYETLLARPTVTVEWIAAHSGNRWNEYADALSTAYLRSTL